MNTMINALLLLVLTGCTASPPARPKADPDAPVVYVAFEPERFQADGKLAVRFPRCDKYRGCQEENVSAGMRWIHNGGQEILVLYDPLGQEALTVNYYQGVIHIKENNSIRQMSRAEMVDTFGLPVPFEALAGWLTTKRDAEEFTEQGWKVRLSDWKGHYYGSMRVDQAPYHMRVIIDEVYPIQAKK